MSTQRPYELAMGTSTGEQPVARDVDGVEPAKALDPSQFARGSTRMTPPPPRALAGGTVAPATEPAPREKRRRATSPRTTTADRPTRWWPVLVAGLVALTVYLFVTAPPPLAAPAAAANALPVRTVFAMLELENDAARALWTEDIVNRGGAQGLEFDERWRDPQVHAGPLPALFLRETAKNLERTPMRLSLFLGSQFPINAANLLTGQQATELSALATSGAPRYFFEPATGRHTAMFPDNAVVDACVTCHNGHEDSPKKDWKLGEIMGATTWMYPEATVPADRAIAMLGALRTSIRQAYTSYLEKAATFPRPPAIGERWPRDGRYLPTADEFMRELARRTSASTMRALTDPAWAEQLATTGDAATPEPEIASAAPTTPRVVGPPREETADTTSTPAPTVPVLVLRSTRATRVTVDRGASRLLITRLPAGTTASLQALPPLKIKVADPAAVELEYGGKRLALPPASSADEDGDVELVVHAVPGKS